MKPKKITPKMTDKQLKENIGLIVKECYAELGKVMAKYDLEPGLCSIVLNADFKKPGKDGPFGAILAGHQCFEGGSVTREEIMSHVETVTEVRDGICKTALRAISETMKEDAKNCKNKSLKKAIGHLIKASKEALKSK